MAINYNLAKVHELSDNDPEFVMQIITLFVTEVPQDMQQIDLGIKTKLYFVIHLLSSIKQNGKSRE